MNNDIENPRVAAMQDAVTRQRLSEHELNQARAIAHHYRSKFSTICDLNSLIIARDNSSFSSASYEPAIKHLVEDIKAAHRQDLGVALEWDNERFS